MVEHTSCSGVNDHQVQIESGSQKPTKLNAGSWLAALSHEKRAALQSLHVIRPVWNLVALLFAAIWAGAVLVMSNFPILPVRLGGYIVIGIAIHGMVILTHEASHLSMFRSRFLDRWMGFLMGAPAFLSHTAYRVHHVDHHRHTREERDPDEFRNYCRGHRTLLALLFYSWLVIGSPVYLVHVASNALRQGSWRDRIDLAVEYLLLAALYVSVFLLAKHFERLDLIVHGWAIPIVIAMAFSNVRSWAEHTMTLPGHPYTRTRTVTSNRLVSFLMCNLNYHLEHHLCPGIPWYNLRKVHELLHDEYRRAGSFIYRSYLRFLWDAFRTGIHGVARSPTT